MNYVLFFPDELRAESLSCYGHETVKTPNFDRLSREGVLFEQCHVQNTVCSPSRCSLATGRYPHVDGHRTLWNLLKPEEYNVFRYLKDAGYEVQVFGKNDLFTSEAAERSTSGFQSFRTDGEKPVSVKRPGEEGHYNFLYQPSPGRLEDNCDSKAVRAAAHFLEERAADGRPFFLFLPLLMPHCPYTIQEPYYSMYSPDRDVLSLREKGEGKPEFQALIRQYRQLNDPEVLKKIQAVYLGMVTYVDHLLGEVMDALDRTGLSPDTMLVAASDHGDYAGDYGLAEKWPSGFDDVLTRVPLVVRAPGCAAGHRSKEPVELFDISATILEKAGIEAHHTQYARSFCRQLSGEPGDPDRAVFCEGGYDPSETHCNEGYPKPGTEFMRDPDTIYYPKGLQQREHPESVCRGVMIRTQKYKLIRRSNGERELYLLETDPLELRNVYGRPEYREIREELEQRLLSWYLGTSDAVPYDTDPRELSEERRK